MSDMFHDREMRKILSTLKALPNGVQLSGIANLTNIHIISLLVGMYKDGLVRANVPPQDWTPFTMFYPADTHAGWYGIH